MNAVPSLHQPRTGSSYTSESVERNQPPPRAPEVIDLTGCASSDRTRTIEPSPRSSGGRQMRSRQASRGHRHHNTTDQGIQGRGGWGASGSGYSDSTGSLGLPPRTRGTNLSVGRPNQDIIDQPRGLSAPHGNSVAQGAVEGGHEEVPNQGINDEPRGLSAPHGNSVTQGALVGGHEQIMGFGNSTTRNVLDLQASSYPVANRGLPPSDSMHPMTSKNASKMAKKKRKRERYKINRKDNKLNNKRRRKKKEKEREDLANCGICQEGLSTGDAMKVQCCSLVLHRACVRECLEKKTDKCPQCRQAWDEDSVCSLLEAITVYDCKWRGGDHPFSKKINELSLEEARFRQRHLDNYAWTAKSIKRDKGKLKARIRQLTGN